MDYSYPSLVITDRKLRKCRYSINIVCWAKGLMLQLPFDVGLHIVWLGRDAQMNVPSPMLAAFEPSTP